MGTRQLDATALDGLRGSFAGQVVSPGDPPYDELRTVHNAMVDGHPAAIALCTGEDDVTAALAFARLHGLEVAVRCGGHGVAGTSTTDGGLVVDLRRMNSVTVDPDARTARVAGGATMGDLDRATTEHGLATTGGRVSTTGVGGLLLGGGSGWLERLHGLACEQLLSVELVTATGERVTASDTQNPELFWALHGGGGNFGVATAFTLRLHPLPDFSIAMFMWPAAAGRDLLGPYRDFGDRAPAEVGGGFLYLTGPPEDFVPPPLVGQPMCVCLVTYAGPEDGLREVTAPMERWGAEAAMVTAVPYQVFQGMLDDPPGLRNYWSAEYLDAVPDEALTRFADRAATIPAGTPTQHMIFPQGGVLAGPTDYPVPWRSSPWAIHPFGTWEDPAQDDACRQWVRDARADMAPWASSAVYLNFIGDEGADRVVAGLGADNLKRLGGVKAEYDPDNVFHLNHNIAPA